MGYRIMLPKLLFRERGIYATERKAEFAVSEAPLRGFPPPAQVHPRTTRLP